MYTCMHAFARLIASHHMVKVHDVTAKHCALIDQRHAPVKTPILFMYRPKNEHGLSYSDQLPPRILYCQTVVNESHGKMMSLGTCSAWLGYAMQCYRLQHIANKFCFLAVNFEEKNREGLPENISRKIIKRESRHNSLFQVTLRAKWHTVSTTYTEQFILLIITSCYLSASYLLHDHFLQDSLRLLNIKPVYSTSK